MKKISVILSALLLAGCAQQTQVTSKERKPFNIKQGEKRLNTAECHDVDDWYLDGFRVGKMHAASKQSAFSQRLDFCQSISQVTDEMKMSWQDGFNKATHSSHKKHLNKRK